MLFPPAVAPLDRSFLAVFLCGVLGWGGIVADGVVKGGAAAAGGFVLGDGLGKKGNLGGGAGIGDAIGAVHVAIKSLPHGHEIGILAGFGFPAGGEVVI